MCATPEKTRKSAASDSRITVKPESELSPSYLARRAYNYKWAREHPEAVKAIRKRFREKTRVGSYQSGRAWGPEEDAMLSRREFSDDTIARLLERSINAVENRRWKIKQQPTNQCQRTNI